MSVAGNAVCCSCCSRQSYGSRPVRLGAEPVTFDPALDLHARLAHRARDGADVAGVLTEELVELLLAADLLGGEGTIVLGVVLDVVVGVGGRGRGQGRRHLGRGGVPPGGGVAGGGDRPRQGTPPPR